MSVLTVVFLLLSICKPLTLLWGEWLALTVIDIHFMLEVKSVSPNALK